MHADTSRPRTDSASRRMLVADIGGTNARFAIADAQATLSEIHIVPTSRLGDGSNLAATLAEYYTLTELDGACIGLAGPVNDGAGKMTNGPLALDTVRLQAALGVRVLLVNDFFALAHGVPHFRQLHQLGGPALTDDQRTQKLRAVLGPGSGLGMSICVPDTGDALGWRILASEGGYADLATTSPLEAEVLALLQARHAHVCWETVVSGPGLVALYRCLASLWGDTQAAEDDQVSAAWITEQARDARVPLCHQTLELFFGFLGAAAGNLALTAYALGGVYVAGGIVPRMLDLAARSPLRRRFDERGPLTGLVEQIPLYLVADEHPGLLGAAIASGRLGL